MTSYQYHQDSGSYLDLDLPGLVSTARVFHYCDGLPDLSDGLTEGVDPGHGVLLELCVTRHQCGHDSVGRQIGYHQVVHQMTDHLPVNVKYKMEIMHVF